MKKKLRNRNGIRNSEGNLRIVTGYDNATGNAISTHRTDVNFIIQTWILDSVNSIFYFFLRDQKKRTKQT